MCAISTVTIQLMLHAACAIIAHMQHLETPCLCMIMTIHSQISCVPHSSAIAALEVRQHIMLHACIHMYFHRFVIIKVSCIIHNKDCHNKEPKCALFIVF